METEVDKEELLKILKKNRDNHRKVFEKAVEAYTEQLVAWHRAQARRILKGDKGERMVVLPEPEDHTDDYDTMIMMMTMEVNDTVTLDFRLFQNLVMDQWNWSHSFAASTASYLAK